MKLEPRHVRFLPSLVPWLTRRLALVGRRNTLQLLETALVVEGHRMRFFLPVADLFFRQALSAWTTVTVPYSRVECYRYAPMRRRRVVATVLLWLSAALGVAVLAQRRDAATLAPLLGLLAVALTLYLHLRLLAPRNEVWFRQADGRLALLLFRVRSRQRQQEFEGLLHAYLRAARERAAQPGKEVRP